MLQASVWLRSLAATLCVVGLAATAACSSSGEKTSNSTTASSPAPAPAPPPSEDGSDQPQWVNGAYLTCQWAGADSSTDADVGCAVTPKAGVSVPNLVTTAWKVVDANRNPVSETQRPGSGGVIFVINAPDVIQLGAQATVTDGAHSAQLYAVFKDQLQGLSDAKLEACFTAQISVEDCFNAVGIQISGDAFATKPTFSMADAACNHPATLPAGAHCDLTTDGMTGDLDQARAFFANGNDLLAADGTILAGQFCDATGILPRWSKEDISQAKRWYPYWKTGEQPCFHEFHPTNLTNTTHDHALVLFDPAQGVNGEPYCFFVILDEPTIFGGQMLRLHILKNPKIFPDAANPWLTAAGITATTSAFACQ